MYIDDVFVEIDRLPGMDEFKALCRRLQLAADNAHKNSLGRIPLPNLIFAAAPGSGTTLHIRLLTELLKTLKLLSFTGEEEYFEWVLSEGEKAFDRFLLRVKAAGGFYGQFRGVIGLDVSQLTDERDEFNIMERLMEYMDARQGKILFILIVPDDTQEHVLQQLLGRFASISPVELIRMPFPREEAKEYVAQLLMSKGFTLSEAAQAALRYAVKQLSDSEEFEGYQTLQNIADVIIWHRVSRQEMDSNEIGADDVAFILDKDGYTGRLNAYAHRTHRLRIGFGANTED